MIRAERLCKTFYPPRVVPVEAVRDATFEVASGEVFGLLGPNGAGKTTLLRMLAGIISPTSGRCLIDDMSVDTAPDEMRRHVGFLSGTTKLYGRLSGREVLRYFGRLHGMAEESIARRTEELCDLLTLREFIDRRCETLSSGQTQRVSVARAILHDPPALILDEPTAGLDIVSSRAILDFLVDARTRGRSILFSTHYMTEAEMLCDRVGLIYQGAILATGTKDELYSRTETGNLQEAFLALMRHSESTP